MSFINIRKIGLILGALIISAAQANAQSYRSESGLCPSKSTQTSVKIATNNTKYIKSKSADNLTALHNKGTGVTLGLAGGPIEVSIQSSFSITSRNNSACVKLEKLIVLLKAKPEIHIASNFRQGTCEYREVLAHEQKHIAELRRFIREHAPKLTREVRKIVRTSETKKIVSETQVKRAQNQIQQDIIARINAYQEKIMDVLRYRQTLIDSPEEYKRVSRLCRNWDKKLSHNN